MIKNFLLLDKFKRLYWLKSYDKTLTRLILILTKLSNNERPTTKELSEEFGIGIRTIQRLYVIIY